MVYIKIGKFYLGHIYCDRGIINDISLCKNKDYALTYELDEIDLLLSNLKSLFESDKIYIETKEDIQK